MTRDDMIREARQASKEFVDVIGQQDLVRMASSILLASETGLAKMSASKMTEKELANVFRLAGYALFSMLLEHGLLPQDSN